LNYLKNKKKKRKKTKMKRIKNLFSRITSILRRPEMQVLPGHLAFSFLLGIVPTFTLIAYIASFFHISFDFISNFLSKALNPEITELLLPMVTNIDNSWQLIVTIIIGFYLASKGIKSIIITSNSVYKIENGASIKRTIKSFLMAFIMVILILFILFAPVFGNKIIEIVEYVNMNSHITNIIVSIMSFISGPISWFIIFFIIKIIYTMAPDRNLPSYYTTKGALFATTGFVIATYIYSLYINSFARNTLLYGGLTHIVTLMVWLYIIAYIFTVGIAINSQDELEKTGTIKTLD